MKSELWEATSLLRSKEIFKTNRYALSSFEEYVNEKLVSPNSERSAMLNMPTSLSGLAKSGSFTSGEGSIMKARLWLARHFPLQLEHLMLVLRVISVANQRVAQLVETCGRMTNPCMELRPSLTSSLAVAPQP